MQKNTRKVAPDGGWGWVATFGVSLVNVSNLCYFSLSSIHKIIHKILGLRRERRRQSVSDTIFRLVIY